MQQRSRDATAGDGSRIELNFLVPGGGPFTTPKPPPSFGSVRHGYDRAQVDEQVADLLEQLNTERKNRETVEEQLAEAQAQGGGGFGGRLERMMRMADREAAELRAAATEEAAEILAEARITTTVHEREVALLHAAQQADAARHTDQLRTERASHQAAMTAELDAARQAAAGVRATAEREAEQVVEQANADSREIRSAARQAATDRHERIRGEIGRLTGTRNGVCAEISRLQELLTHAVESVVRNAADSYPGTDEPCVAVDISRARAERDRTGRA